MRRLAFLSGSVLTGTPARVLFIALGYFFSAKYGLRLAFEHTNATPVWPASGIALAAALSWGNRIWPGIFAGAFLANLSALSAVGFSDGASIVASASTAAGNTLEAVVGAFLIRTLLKSRYPFDRAVDTLLFIVLGPLLSTTLSASIGTLSFYMSRSDGAHFGTMWVTWWLGDATGALIVAPVFLTLRAGTMTVWRAARTCEASLAILLLLAVAILTFHFNHPVQHLALPILIWIVFRFGLFTASLSVLVLSGTALVCTLGGSGPFVRCTLNESLLFLQSYVGITATAVLFLAVIISERQRAEAELRAYKTNLEDLVEARTVALRDSNTRLQSEIEERTRTAGELGAALDELAVARDRAEESDRLKSAFLASMSHELRTPLNSIIGFSGILRQGLAGPLNEEQQRQLGMVQKSSHHLLSLINDVLDISKIEAGQLPISRVPFDLRTAVEVAVKSVRPLAEQKGLDFEVGFAPEVGVVVSDQRRVEQVLLNLLSNAIKFTERGSVRVECGTETGFVVVRVVDSGIGIREDDIPRLFLPFHQLDSGTTRRFEGTGLGLSICKKLARMLGGEIRIESELGKGSTFSFALPV